MTVVPASDSSTTPLEPTQVTLVHEFPDRADQIGTPPLVGYLMNGEPFFLREAVGSMSFLDGEPLALEFRTHESGQMDRFMCRTQHMRTPPGGYPPELRAYARVYIRQGAVTTDDLDTIYEGELGDLTFGWERGRDGHGQHPLTFVDGPDLSRLDTLDKLEVNAIEFSDEHLGTLGSARRLSSLSLTGADVSGRTLRRLPELRILHLDDPHSLGTDLGFLKWMPNLYGLDVRFSEIGQPALPTIAAHSGIRVLDIAYNSRMGPDLTALARMTQLILLNASGTGADDSTIGHLRGLGRLEVLDLQCTKITDGGLGALSSLTRVTTLKVAGNRITDDGLKRIVDAMPQLRTLDIRGTDVTPNGAMATGRLKNLRTLGLSGDVLTIRLAEHLEDETALAQVDVCPPHPDSDEETEAIDIIGGARYVGVPV